MNNHNLFLPSGFIAHFLPIRKKNTKNLSILFIADSRRSLEEHDTSTLAELLDLRDTITGTEALRHKRGNKAEKRTKFHGL